MPCFLRYTFSGIILGALVGVPAAYTLWQRQHYRNFHVVREGVLYRSGQLPLDGLQRIIHDHHIKTVVTLRYPPAADKPAPDQAEERMCRAQGLHYFRLPYHSWSAQDDETADRGVPADANVQQFLDIMKDPRNYPVLVHCFAGIHRTGAMCAVYRMEFEHWSPEQAIQEMKELGYSTYHRDVFAYLENYQPKGHALGQADTPSSDPLIPAAGNADADESAGPKPWIQKLSVDGVAKDFGTVAKGTQLEHKFKMTNVDEALAKKSAFDVMFSNSAPHRYAHQAQPGDIVQLDLGDRAPRLSGRYVVRPDGTLNLGEHGSIHVAGLSHEQIPVVVRQRLALIDVVSIDLVPGDNFRNTYRITVRDDLRGAQIATITWNASHSVFTVLHRVFDELAENSRCRAWIIRRGVSAKGPSNILPVDCEAVRDGRASAANWPIKIGDEICIDAVAEQPGNSIWKRTPQEEPATAQRNRNESEPDEATILRAMKPVQHVPYVHEASRSNLEFVVERVHAHFEPLSDFVLIGPAQSQKSVWKCTVSYTENVRTLFPIPMRTQSRREQVVYIDREVLRPIPHASSN